MHQAEAFRCWLGLSQSLYLKSSVSSWGMELIDELPCTLTLMSVCSPVIPLLVASPFFPHEEQERGGHCSFAHPRSGPSVGLPLPGPSLDAGGRGEPSTPLLHSRAWLWCCRVPSVKLKFDRHRVSRADPHFSLSWSIYQESVGRKQASTTRFNCLLLFAVRNLCLLYSHACAFCFILLLKQWLAIPTLACSF